MAIVYENELPEGITQEEMEKVSGIGKLRKYHGIYKPKTRREISRYVKEYYEEHKMDYKAARDRYRAKLAEQGITEADYHTPEYNLLQRIRVSFAKSRGYLERGKKSLVNLKELLMAEERWRAKDYLEKNNMNNKTKVMEKKRILCILGESGVGKTLASLHLKNHCGANVICSYTTRPPRENEVDGREHHFIDMAQPDEYMLAYAMYGRYAYYALKSQVYGPLTIYVVDQAGLESLKERNSDELEIFTLFITRSRKLRLLRGITSERMDRDKGKNTMSLDEYDYVVENNSTKRELFNNIERIYNELVNRR